MGSFAARGPLIRGRTGGCAQLPLEFRLPFRPCAVGRNFPCLSFAFLNRHEITDGYLVALQCCKTSACLSFFLFLPPHFPFLVWVEFLASRFSDENSRQNFSCRARSFFFFICMFVCKCCVCARVSRAWCGDGDLFCALPLTCLWRSASPASQRAS